MTGYANYVQRTPRHKRKLVPYKVLVWLLYRQTPAITRMGHNKLLLRTTDLAAELDCGVEILVNHLEFLRDELGIIEHLSRGTGFIECQLQPPNL